MTTFRFTLKGLRVPFRAKKRRRGLEVEYEGLVGRLITSATSASAAPVVGVTACSYGEGVTTIATNLAAAAGRSLEGNTLLVDAHTDQPEVERLFGLDAGPGTCEALAGQRLVQDCTQLTQVPRLAVMGPGAEAISSGFHRPETWHGFVESLRRSFQLVLVDLPPVPKLLSQVTVAQSLDGILLVVRAERTRTKVAQRYRDQLARVNPQILGIVLNGRRTYVPNWLYQRI
ncbi:MAG: CpsD/CapB family tyrosine-protein kinase [Pirellulaceae bacterium]